MKNSPAENQPKRDHMKILVRSVTLVVDGYHCTLTAFPADAAAGLGIEEREEWTPRPPVKPSPEAFRLIHDTQRALRLSAGWNPETVDAPF
jgi:hypothetical protein